LGLTTGTAKWFNDSKGLGFVTQDDGGNELFADFSEVSAAGFKSLQENQKVSFDVKTGPKGKQAANIKPVCGKSASLNRTIAGPSGAVPSRRSRASPPGGRVAPAPSNQASNAKPSISLRSCTQKPIVLMRSPDWAFYSRVGSSAFRRRNGSPSDNMRSCS
jgi:CspA family cold shock protein